MIQVDFFWAYAFGATFAFAACRQIKEETCKWYESKYFTWTIFYLAIFFAPSGVWLLKEHTSWETMQLFNTYQDIPTLWVLIFTITNVLDGVIAYYVCHRFIKKGNYFGAASQVIIGYFIMFFILAHGWDGWGFDRFFYDRAVNNDVAWTPRSGDVFQFMTSTVAITLYVMGILILPPMFYFSVKWLREGLDADDAVPGEKIPSPLAVIVLMLLAALGLALGLAVGATLVCKFFTWITGGNQAILGAEWSLLGMVIGLPVFLLPVWYFVLRRGKIAHKFAMLLIIEEPMSSSEGSSTI